MWTNFVNQMSCCGVVTLSFVVPELIVVQYRPNTNYHTFRFCYSLLIYSRHMWWWTNTLKQTHPCLYVMWNEIQQQHRVIVFIEVFMAHWHPVAVLMTHYARHTTKQPDSLKGIGTNQYGQNQTLIILQDIFCQAYCWAAFHTTAQVTSPWFYVQNGWQYMGGAESACSRLLSV